MTALFSGEGYIKSFKRVIDIVAAIFLLVLFSPIFVITAIMIVIDSEGPIFADVPERIGEKGKRFKMYKFRSMITNAHYMLRTDPRFTKLYDQYKKGSYKLKKDPISQKNLNWNNL